VAQVERAARGYADHWMAAHGRRPGFRVRPGARKPWAWWHGRSLEMEPPAEHADIRRCEAALLPAPVFRALGPGDTLPPHAYLASYTEAVEALARALERLRGIVGLGQEV
jgi:hypothetical protein